MPPALIAIVGLLCFPLSVALGFGYFLAKRELEQFSAIESVKIAKLLTMARELQRAVGKDVKRGGLVKLSGKVVCDRPLTSELFQESCVYYKCAVKWEYEELTYYRETVDENGNVTNRERLNHPPAGDRGSSVGLGGGSNDDYGSGFGSSEGASYGGYSGEGGSSGGYSTRIHTDSSNGWEIIYEDRRHTRFVLQDESGQIAIDPDDAEI